MQVLNPQQLHSLLSIVRAAEENSLQSFAEELQRSFTVKDNFSLCCAAVWLLQDKHLLTPSQRLNLWFAIVSTYSASPAQQNPFISFLVKACSDSTLPAVERTFLLNLLHASDLQQISSSTAQNYLDSFVPDGVPPLPDGQALEEAFLNKLSLSPVNPHPAAPSSNKSAAVKSSTPDSKESRLSNLSKPQHTLSSSNSPPPASGCNPSSTAHTPNGTVVLSPPNGNVVLLSPNGIVATPVQQGREGFDLAWERPAPAPLTPPLHELKWLGPHIPQPLMWEVSLKHDSDRANAVKETIAKALGGPLLPAQQQQVLSHLEADPRLAHQTGLTPAQLPLLVEHTPLLAYELLLRLVHGRQAHQYLAVLAAMDMSLHSMEVVNRLTSAAQLPVEFVHLYVTNCINSCETTPDKNMQGRFVRLVCVFLQNLIKKGALNVWDLLHEVQAFCINFSRIREAAALFRLLKQYEVGAAGGNDGSVNRGGDGHERESGSSPAAISHHHKGSNLKEAVNPALVK